MNAFWLAVQFLTRLPVRFQLKFDDKQVALSVLYYPLVGLLIGWVLVGLGFALQHHIALPIQAALLLTCWVVITGGLHLDGLADCTDAWVGGFGNPQRSLEIMKDPAAGPMAVLSLVLLLLLKWTVLAELLAQSRLGDLIMIPLLGRCAILALMLSTRYVRKNGLSSGLLPHLSIKATQMMLLVCVLLSAYTVGFWSLCFATLMLLCVRKLALQRLGGVTGDVYGAAVELVEVAALVGLVVV